MFETYNQQVQLLLTCLPTVAKTTIFALKGGTAINMFAHQGYPRLSVDIDLTYLPIHGRDESLLAIENGLLNIATELELRFNYKIEKCLNDKTRTTTKIKVSNNIAKITIEPNLIFRGTLYPITHQHLSKKVQDLYNISVLGMPVLAFEELYAGKICAALDRQHPRDLFDVKFILEEGLSERTKIAFLIYLISSNRPMHELLAPNIINQKDAFNDEFSGMTDLKISYEDLENIREQLIATIKNILTEEDKQFLLSVKKFKPNWQHINIKHVENLPSVKWKMINLAKMDKLKAKEYLEKLTSALYD